MRIETTDGIRREYPDEGKWLHDDAPDYTRVFKDDFVILGKEAQPWSECTTAEKEEWEREHPQPEPDETAL